MFTGFRLTRVLYGHHAKVIEKVKTKNGGKV